MICSIGLNRVHGTACCSILDLGARWHWCVAQPGVIPRKDRNLAPLWVVHIASLQAEKHIYHFIFVFRKLMPTLGPVRQDNSDG